MHTTSSPWWHTCWWSVAEVLVGCQDGQASLEQCVMMLYSVPSAGIVSPPDIYCGLSAGRAEVWECIKVSVNTYNRNRLYWPQWWPQQCYAGSSAWWGSNESMLVSVNGEPLTAWHNTSMCVYEVLVIETLEYILGISYCISLICVVCLWTTLRLLTTEAGSIWADCFSPTVKLFIQTSYSTVNAPH